MICDDHLLFTKRLYKNATTIFFSNLHFSIVCAIKHRVTWKSYCPVQERNVVINTSLMDMLDTDPLDIIGKHLPKTVAVTPYATQKL